MVLLQPMKWYANGLALGQGFNAVAAARGAGMPGGGGASVIGGGKMGKGLMGGMKGFGAGMRYGLRISCK